MQYVMIAALGIEDWIRAQRRRKYNWAGHMTRRRDGRWSTAVSEWQPTQGTGRTPGGQYKRWTDAFNDFFKAECDLDKDLWRAVALNTVEWKRLEDRFVNFRLT